MTLNTAIERLQAWGCKAEPPDEINRVTVWDPDGNCLRIEDGAQWVMGKAYAVTDNDPTRMVDILDMAHEHDDDGEEIMRQIFPWSEEAEDEAKS